MLSFNPMRLSSQYAFRASPAITQRSKYLVSLNLLLTLMSSSSTRRMCKAFMVSLNCWRRCTASMEWVEYLRVVDDVAIGMRPCYGYLTLPKNGCPRTTLGTCCGKAVYKYVMSRDNSAADRTVEPFLILTTSLPL